MNLVPQSYKQANSVRLEDFSTSRTFPSRTKLRQRRGKTIQRCQGGAPHFPSAHVTIPSTKPTAQNPSKCHKSSAPGTGQRPPRAGQCSTTLLQLHRAHSCSTTAPGKARGSSVLGTSAQAWHHPQRLSRTNSGQEKAPRKPAGLQEHHTFQTHTLSDLAFTMNSWLH